VTFPRYATQVALYQHFLNKPNPALVSCVNVNTCEVLHLALPFVRLFGSDSEGEVLAEFGAPKRFLKAHDASFTDFGNVIEKLATGALADDQMQHLFDAAHQKGFEDATRKQVEAEGAFGLRPDGSPDWERIALYCQREKRRLKEYRHRQFVDDMASRMTWSREPTPKQATYLLSLFRQRGGRVK
jgi:hypothetical protein